MTPSTWTILVGSVLLYLALQGSVFELLWLILAIVDSFRALRVIRPNGRTVGKATRRKAMTETLVSWIAYAAIEQAEPIISRLFGWLPFYAPLKAIACLAFLFLRQPASGAIYTSLLRPFFRQYEKPIDLILLLLHSLSAVIVHFGVTIPLSLAADAIKRIRLAVTRTMTSPSQTPTGNRIAVQTETVVISDEDDADDIVPIEANVSLSTPHVPGRLLRSARKPAASSRQISRAEVGESSTSGLISPSKSIRPSDGSPEAMHHRHLSPGPRIQAAEGSRRVMEPETPRRSSRRRARFLLDEGERLDEIAEGGQEVPEDDGPTSSRPAYTPSSSSLPAAAVTARPAQTSTSAPRRPASPSGDAEAGPSRLYPSLPVFPSVPTALASSSSMTLSGTGLGPVPHGAKASIKRLVSSGSGILSTSTATTTTSARPIRRAPLRVRPDDPLHPTASLAAAPSRARATASSGSGARASARNVQAAFTRPRALDRTSASSGSSGDSGNSNSARLPQAKKRNEENRAVGSTEEDGSKEAGGREISGAHRPDWRAG
ncbi:uncharacterized protein MKK02DRAFT_28957 [Dioszegia hungarica]|uniref:Uncharacterized protein n=1 Tax=Dioszegia hungarica TaxID=4972 RepID=A0AA38H5W1_9TREE|nr:uncharacterized protein MKK02DRAFT_28957 [Dioszegia hungarica]KAI9634327.1 hypothetical protein MKK02DRAFT_28957 [Dioszegia hungarica]